MATAGNPIPPVQAVAMAAVDCDIEAGLAARRATEDRELRMIAAALTADTSEEFMAGLDAIIERIAR